MTRRIFVIALAAAAVFAAVLGAVSPAQDPTPTGTPAGTPAASSPRPWRPPSRSPAPTRSRRRPRRRPRRPTEAATSRRARHRRGRHAGPDRRHRGPAPAPTVTGTAAPTVVAPAQGRRPQAGSRRRRRTPRTPRSSSRRSIDLRSRVTEGDAEQESSSSKAPKLTTTTGAPAPSNPTFALATPGAAPIGVPNFFIDKFRIPPFLLSIYQAAGMQYGVRWEVLAAINEIETDYGRNLNVSYAGALGLDAVHARHLEDVRRRREPRRREGPLQPGRRDLRGRALPARRRAPTRTSAGPSSPTTTPIGTSTRCCCAPVSSAASRVTSSARSPASRRAGSPCTPRRPTPARSRRPTTSARSAPAPTRPWWSSPTGTAAASTSSPARAPP